MSRYCNYTIFVGVVMLVISATQIYRFFPFSVLFTLLSVLLFLLISFFFFLSVLFPLLSVLFFYFLSVLFYRFISFFYPFISSFSPFFVFFFLLIRAEKFRMRYPKSRLLNLSIQWTHF